MKRVLLAILVVLLVMAMFWGPSCDGNYLSPLQAAAPSTLNWANTTCNEAVMYTTFASAQKKVSKVGDYVASRGGKFVVCNAVSTVSPSCPAQKDCPACNCPACPACPPHKDCPTCPACPAQKDCPDCNCPACPTQKDCPACNCPACPNLKCPDAVPCPTLQPQPIEFIVQGNVSSTKV